jgi:P-type E1-E2 ATPase
VRDLIAGSGRCSQARSRSGSGSRRCSPISPKRSRKGEARADSLRRTRSDSKAKRLADPRLGDIYQSVNAPGLRVGDIVLVEAGDNIPSDGEIVESFASVNETAITGESAPVVREAGGDRSAVTGGTIDSRRGWIASLCSR